MKNLDVSTNLSNEKIFYNSHAELSNDDLLLSRFFPWYVKYISCMINIVNGYSDSLSSNFAIKLLSVGIRKKIKSEDQIFYKKGNKQLQIFSKKKFYTYTYGEGPEIICIHGWCSNGAQWRNHVQKIVDKGYKAVVIDAPAHGTSPGLFLSIRDYISLLENVFNERKNICGILTHSIGSLCGVIALNRSNINSENFKIVMMATFNSCEELLKKFSRCVGINSIVLKSIKEWIPDYAGNPLEYYTIEKHLPEINGKVLLVHDNNDFVVPKSEVNLILNKNKKIEFHHTSGLGHLLRGEEVEDVITNFMTH